MRQAIYNGAQASVVYGGLTFCRDTPTAIPQVWSQTDLDFIATLGITLYEPPAEPAPDVEPVELPEPEPEEEPESESDPIPTFALTSPEQQSLTIRIWPGA